MYLSPIFFFLNLPAIKKICEFPTCVFFEKIVCENLTSFDYFLFQIMKLNEYCSDTRECRHYIRNAFCQDGICKCLPKNVAIGTDCEKMSGEFFSKIIHFFHTSQNMCIKYWLLHTYFIGEKLRIIMIYCARVTHIYEKYAHNAHTIKLVDSTLSPRK